MKTRPRRRRLVPLLSAAFTKSISGAGMRRFRQHHRRTSRKASKAVAEYLGADDINPRYELWASLVLLDIDELISVPTDSLSMSLADFESISLPFSLPSLSFLDMSTAVDFSFDYSWTGQGGDEDDLSLSMPNISMSVDEYVYFWEIFDTFQPTAQPITKPTAKPTAKPTTGPTTGPIIEPTAELITEPPKNDLPDQEDLNSAVTNKVPTGSPTKSTHSNPTAPPQPPSSQTPVPTSHPNNTLTSDTAVVQFQMRSMQNTMNDYEVLGIFQPSCQDYLTRQLMYEEPEVYNIECEVIKQQLISRRVLTESDARRLDESSALLVDINVTGATFSEVDFSDIIQDAFVRNMGLFINSLKNKGEFAGIDTFDQLTSIDSVQQSNDKSAIGTDDDSNDEGTKTRALIIVVTGVASIALFIGALVYHRLKSSPAEIYDDDGEESEEAEPPPEHVLVGSKTTGLGYFGLDFLNSPDDSPVDISSDDEVPKVRRVIIAPPGKLGVITDDSVDGPIVHSVRDDSPLKGLVFPGDLIVGLDDENTSELSSHNLTKLVASRSKFEREITVLSEVLKRR